MEQVEIEITSLCSTARFGNLAPGDVVRTDAAYARHLVEEACAAKYPDPKPAAETPPQAKPARPGKKPVKA